MKHPIMVMDPHRTGALKLRYYPANSLQPGVSAWMILTQLALVNGLSAAELNSQFWPSVPNRYPRSFDYDLNLPGWRVKYPGTLLQGAFFTLQGANGFCPEHPMSEYQVTCLRFCPECLAQGIHLLIFQWTFIAVCPIHRLPLITRCCRCHQAIAYRFNADTFKLPGHCPRCFNALIAITAVDRLNRQAHKLFPWLLDFTRQLQHSLKQCHDSAHLTGLTSWFKAFPASYPAHTVRRKQALAWLRPTSGFYRTQCETMIEDMHRCYRSIRRGLWRQLSRTERQQLGYWVQSHPGAIAQPVPSTLNRRQTTYLFWRMVWEGRTKPGSLFQRSLAPYTGLWVWRLFNLFQEEHEGKGEIISLPSKELQAFNEALNHTYQICDQLARRMMGRNQICFDRNWVEIPSNFLSPSPFFQASSG